MMRINGKDERQEGDADIWKRKKIEKGTIEAVKMATGQKK